MKTQLNYQPKLKFSSQSPHLFQSWLSPKRYNYKVKIKKKIENLLLILSLLIFFPASLYAGETGKIAGKITDASTGEALIGANIVITGKWIDGAEQSAENLLGASTDVEGEYFILNIPPGLYSIRASYIGYKEQITVQVQVDVDKTTRVDFQLTPEAFQTDEVVVVAHTPQTVEKDLTATKQVYNINDVQTLAGVSDIADILELQADVVDDHFRGGRVGESLYLIGGATIVNPLNNERAFRPIVTGLQQVEVYTSGFSAEYGNAQSGIVNMVAKEGGDKWETRLEASTTPPYYKSWAGSVYSPSNLDFYNTLQDVKAWLEENPTQPGRALFDAGFGFGSTYLPPRNVWPPNPLTLKDSLEIARLGQVAWLQSIRDVGLEYNNNFDYRFDFTTGGPIAKDFKIFVAARQNLEYPIVPTPNQNVERQVMSNLTYQPTEFDKFKFRFIYDYQYENILNSNWLRWMFDRTLSVSREIQNTKQYGFDWQHVFNQSTILDLKLNLLQTELNERIELLDDGEFIQDYNNRTNWVDYTGPSAHRVGRANDDRGDEETTTYDIHASILTQFNKYNLIKGGLQFSYYNVDVDRELNVVDAGGYRAINFNYYPFEGALYLQDKMEFEGFIANVGLRLDFYDFNAEYFSDLFSPLRNPYYDENLPYLERGQYYDRNLAAKEKTKLYAKLQPRIGISFPVTEFSVFHLNYGTFTQRPSFDQVFFSQITAFNDIEILGNPRLKPENTKAYDIGLVNAFPLGIKLDISAYYKDVTNLVETAYFYDQQQTVYRTYTNRDYADIKGFHISVEKNDGALRGFIRYNYEAATGKSSNEFNAPVTYFENPPEGQEAIEIPDAEDVFLDYDRTHKAVFNLRYITDKQFGFTIGDFHPLADISISVTFRLFTGRPYTWDETGQGLRYNKRTPTERDLRVRLEKKIPFGRDAVVFYLEGFNLLNQEIYHYSRMFNSDENTVRWEKDRADVLTYKEYAPYATSQEVYLLNNQPRHFRLGMIFRF